MPLYDHIEPAVTVADRDRKRAFPRERSPFKYFSYLR